MAESRISIFLSYRRDDTRYVAGRLADRLGEEFHLFMDTDTIQPGMDFIEVIRREVAECDILIAVIGSQWATLVDSSGRRRIDDPKDWVAEEIRVALERKIRVIPILVDGARMPEAEELPPSLTRLASLQALTLRHESFVSDSSRLISAIRAATADKVAPEAISDTTIAAWYATGLTQLSAGQWAAAVNAFAAVQANRADYRDASALLATAREQQWLDGMYEYASQAAAHEDWGPAVDAWAQIVAAKPTYRDAASRLAAARIRQGQGAAGPAGPAVPAGPGAKKSSLPKWAWGVGIGLAAIILVLVVVTSVTLVRSNSSTQTQVESSTPSPSPTPTSTPTANETDPVALATLLSHIPASFRSTCVELPINDEGADAGITASISCVPSDGPSNVYFDLYSSTETAQAGFEFWGEEGLPEDTCEVGPAETDYTFDDVVAGRLACYTDTDDDVRFVWYDYDLAILGLSWSGVMGYPEMYEWWTGAGPE